MDHQNGGVHVSLCFTGLVRNGVVVAKLKRMMNGAEKAGRRPGNVARTMARKIRNSNDQDQRARDNERRRANGEATPWDLAKAKRAAIRQGVQLAS